MKLHSKTGVVLLLFFLLQATVSLIVHHLPISFEAPAHGAKAVHYAAYSRAWIPEVVCGLILTAALMLFCRRTFLKPMKRLAERERYYRSILFGMSDEVIVLDPDYRITDINRETIPCTNAPRAAAIGRHPHEVFPGGSAIFKNGETEEMTAAVFRTRKSRCCRQKAREDGGREMWKDLRISPLMDENGQVSHAILSVRDVTREAHLENQLRQSHKLEAIGALAGGIAHDFNNLLMTILLNIEYVMAKCPAESAERESMEMALEAGRRAGDLVDQILTFSRKNHAAKQPLALAPLVKETLKMLRASLPATIEIRQKIDATSEMVLADPSQIQEILINVCTNAADAMKGGPGVISVGLGEHCPGPDDPLPDESLRGRSYLRLTVQDNGVGMSESVQDNIFEPFFTTRPCQAAGMGLAMAHGAVKGMEGAIFVRSAPEKGSRFDILLPCCLPEEGESETPPVNGCNAAKGRILVVDDDETVVQILTKTLSEAGYEVTGEIQGGEALNRFKASPDQYDLLITDLTMPEMTGIALSRKIQDFRPGLPVVMTTGYGEVFSPGEARKMGIRELMAKPVSGARLLTVVHRILENKN